jgi:hypothetical protein
MLIRIPDEYKAIFDLLGRNGIPYTLIEHEESDKDVISKKIDLLNEVELINLDKVDRVELLEKALGYFLEKTKIPESFLEYYYNSAIRRAYSELSEE